MFSTKGLPKETKRAEFIVREADFMKAEPWDMRLGVGLWSKITDNDINPSLIPFFFADLCKLNISEFNSIVPEMIANTHYGKELRDNIINNASYRRNHVPLFRYVVLPPDKPVVQWYLTH